MPNKYAAIKYEDTTEPKSVLKSKASLTLIYSFNYYMSSEYSTKTLAIGHSFPLKLRFMIDRAQTPQTATLKKLISVFFQRVNSQQDTRHSNKKQNSHCCKNAQNIKKTLKPKRVISHRQQRCSTKTEESRDELYLDLLNLDQQGEKGSQKGFVPYHLQEVNKKEVKTEQTDHSPPNEREELRSPRFGQKGKTQMKCSKESWKVEQWQPHQESLFSPFFDES